MQKLMQTSKTTQSISAKFTQEKIMSIVPNPIISKGLFFFKQPEQIRWEYQTPFKHLMIVANGKMIVKDENKTKEQDLSKNMAARELKKLISGMVSGQMLQNNKMFKTTVYENANSYKLVLIPANPSIKNYIAKIQHYFNKATLQTTRVEIMEKDGDQTILTFDNVQVNGTVNDSMFKAP
ncbi:MAG TPA: outer membrane lipoprotein carrier protein LolA [Chitinophagales bacterium]